MRDVVQRMYQDAAEYDLEHANLTEDIPFWIEVARRYEARLVLELAVGTGRIAIPLARAGVVRAGSPQVQQGFSVAGLDLVPEMLARCREKLAQEEPAVQTNLTLYEKDMCRFELEQQFDLIFVGFNSVLHLLTMKDRLATFSCAQRQLAPGGRLIVDVFSPSLFLLLQAQEQVPRLEPDLDAEDPSVGQRLLRSVSRRYDETTQTVHARWFVEKYRKGVQREKRVQDVSFHIYFPEELRLLFGMNGFAVEDVYGDYDWRPFAAGCRRMIFLGRRM